MASNADTNCHNITAAAGWESSPYVSLSGTQRQQFDSPVQEGAGSCGNLEKSIVLAPNPLSVDLPLNVVTPQPQPLVVVEQKSRRRCLSTAKVVSVLYVSFNYLKSREDPGGYDLGMYEVGSHPEVEGTTPGLSTYDHILPFPGLLKNWKRETRERPNGAQDKFYFHPTCKRMLRSLVEVMNFIKSANNITLNEKTEELQDLQQVKLSESSLILPNDKERGNINPYATSKKRRIFPVSFRALLKTREPLGVEEFYAEAYRNLVHLYPSTPEPAIIEEEEKNSVEAFLLDAEENLLKGGFQKEEIRIHPTPTAGRSYQNGSPEEIRNHELSRENDTSQQVHNLEPSKPIQQQGGNANADDVQAGMNRLTDKEMEVVKIFTQGLGRCNFNDQPDVDNEDLLDYSHFLFEPIPPDLF